MPWFLEVIFMHRAHFVIQSKHKLTQNSFTPAFTHTHTHSLKPKGDQAWFCSLVEVCLAQHLTQLPVASQKQTSEFPASLLNPQTYQHTHYQSFKMTSLTAHLSLTRLGPCCLFVWGFYSVVTADNIYWLWYCSDSFYIQTHIHAEKYVQ